MSRVHLGTKILKGIGGNPIIALIVHIAIRFLNEAMSFSLFNAMQILSANFEHRVGISQLEKHFL